MNNCEIFSLLGTFSFAVGVLAKFKLLKYIEDFIEKILLYIQKKLDITGSNFRVKGEYASRLLIFYFILIGTPYGILYYFMIFKYYLDYLENPGCCGRYFSLFAPSSLIALALLWGLMKSKITSLKKFDNFLESEKYELRHLIHSCYIFITIGYFLPAARFFISPEISNDVIGGALAFPALWVLIIVAAMYVHSLLFGIYGLAWLALAIPCNILNYLNSFPDRMVGNISFIAGVVSFIVSYFGFCSGGLF